MIYFEIYLFMQLCLMSMINLMLIYKYYLVILITLELIIMNFSVLMFIMYSYMNLEMMFIYYLTFSVCESVMGLTILVLVIRFYGNDYYKSFSMNKF